MSSGGDSFPGRTTAVASSVIVRCFVLSVQVPSINIGMCGSFSLLSSPSSGIRGDPLPLLLPLRVGLVDPVGNKASRPNAKFCRNSSSASGEVSDSACSFFLEGDREDELVLLRDFVSREGGGIFHLISRTSGDPLLDRVDSEILVFTVVWDDDEKRFSVPREPDRGLPNFAAFIFSFLSLLEDSPVGDVGGS